MNENAPSSVGLIVKATRSCNLRCSYCNDWRPGSGNAMSFNVLSHLIAAALSDPHHQGVRFSWHGGEPTLLPHAFFEKAMFLQDRFRRPGQHVANSIMSNATRINEQWADFLAANEFSVGISLDGPPEIHDRYRVDAAGKPSYERTRKGIRLLQGRGIAFTVTVVVDRAGLDVGPERLFNFLVGEGITSFGLNFVMPPFGAPTVVSRQHYIYPQERAEFLRGIYEQWRNNGDPSIRVRELDTLRNRIRGVSGPVPCTVSGDCWGALYSIEPNGDIAHCDFFLGGDDYVWGNVLTDDFTTIRTSPRLGKMKRWHAQKGEAKATCSEFNICRGGCPHEFLMSEIYAPDHRSACCGLDDLIRQMRVDAAKDPPAPLLIGMPARRPNDQI